MVSLQDRPARLVTESGSPSSNASTATAAAAAAAAATTATDSSSNELLCAFQSQARDRLRPVSDRYSEDLQQCAMFDSEQDNAKLIGSEYVVTDKIFSKLSEEEKLLWHAHDVQLKDDFLSSSPGIQETELRQALKEVPRLYGRVVQSSPDGSRNALPPQLAELMASLTDAEHLHQAQLASDLKNRHVSFVGEDEEPQNSIPKMDKGIRPVDGEGFHIRKQLAPKILENVNSKEDEYLNDAVHRPAVHHMPTHVPALTDRLPENGQFLTETRSATF